MIWYKESSSTDLQSYYVSHSLGWSNERNNFRRPKLYKTYSRCYDLSGFIGQIIFANVEKKYKHPFKGSRAKHFKEMLGKTIYLPSDLTHTTFFYENRRLNLFWDVTVPDSQSVSQSWRDPNGRRISCMDLMTSNEQKVRPVALHIN